jgi:hypothetical protein
MTPDDKKILSLTITAMLVLSAAVVGLVAMIIEFSLLP